LEKLEALVGSSEQAQESVHSPTVISSESPIATAIAANPSLASESHSRDKSSTPEQHSSPSQPLSFCKCMLDPPNFLSISGTEFQPMCHCGASKDMNQHAGHGVGVSSFLEAERPDPMYAGLPSSDPFHPNPLPTSTHPGMTSLPMATTVSMDLSVTSPSAEALSMLSLDSHSHQSQFPKFPFSTMSYQYPIPVGTTMVPMGFVAIPGMHDCLLGLQYVLTPR
jgi:hypothetical protein